MRILAVAGGRLLRHGQATCGGWLDDASGCRLACDGGRFQLRRLRTDDGLSFRLLLGGAASSDATDSVDNRAGLLLSSCDREGGPETRLVPAGNRSTADVALTAD